ncbi:MAG: Mur ligase family protein [Christensenellales bacterium]
MAALVVSGLSGLALLLEALMALLLVVRASREKAKKPFVVTERVKRLIAIHAAVNTLLAFILLWISPVLAYLLPAFEPVLLMLAAVIAAPLEKHIANQFVKDAQARLDAMPSLIKIGITGSYGKTSTGFLLRDILSVKYSVLATPSSFNTTMGVTRVIREQLTPAHQVFIAEMGARHVGDIKELVELVHPSMGLITSVGPQHLDTFGTIERVRDTKYELIDGLPGGRNGDFRAGRRNLRGSFTPCPLEHKYMPGMLVDAKEIASGPWGTRFTLVDTQTGEQAPCQRRLLGEHSISNLLLCCTAARALGMTLEEIALGVSHCQPVEHRLRCWTAARASASSTLRLMRIPVGAQCALRVIAGFPGRRIIITPGMVELGGEEAAFNRKFGGQMAKSVDVAILVGKKHTQPIVEGLKNAGFPQENIHVVGNLEESTTLLHSIMKAGDVVLYENDLPDNYSE